MSLQAPIVLSTGALARYPLARKRSYSTRTNKFADFSRQTFSQLATPLGQWVLNLSLLQDSEVHDWQDFFDAALGSGQPFAFVDPWDNLLQYSEQQENAVWSKGTGLTVTTSSSNDPFGIPSSRVREIYFPLSTIITQNVGIAPAGNGNSRTSGMMFTASVYLQQVSGGPSSINLWMLDSVGGEGTGIVCNLTSSWQRFSVTSRFPASSTATYIQFSMGYTNVAGNVNVFGAQIDAAGKASGYKKTGSYCGFHSKCYFQTDEFDHTASEFNVNSGQFVIEESN